MIADRVIINVTEPGWVQALKDARYAGLYIAFTDGVTTWTSSKPARHELSETETLRRLRNASPEQLETIRRILGED